MSIDIQQPRTDVVVEVPVELLHHRRRRVIPKQPTTKGRPKADRAPLSATSAPDREADPELWTVHDALRELDPTGARAGYAIRESLDQIYDGQRTGRWDYTQLSKTEKTHVGSLVEIWLQREFGFKDGIDLDYAIAGVDVDCKWSLNLYGWEIPMEMYSRGNQIALVVWGNDYTSRWALGLIRISEDVLVPMGKQRDRKRRLNDLGKDRILWTVPGSDLIENTLLHVQDPEVLSRIVYAKTGQQAIVSMFRDLTGTLINRAAVQTAAQQIDSAKRVRDARRHLAPEGIVIFGHYQPHPQMAADLGLPAPTLGRFVSTRLTLWREGDQQPWIEVAGDRWRCAAENEPSVQAPKLPERSQLSGS